jgi:hypothetical protein
MTCGTVLSCKGGGRPLPVPDRRPGEVGKHAAGPDPSKECSRKKGNLRAALALYFAYYNFVKFHKRVRMTPADEGRDRQEILDAGGATQGRDGEPAGGNNACLVMAPPSGEPTLQSRSFR